MKKPSTSQWKPIALQESSLQDGCTPLRRSFILDSLSSEHDVPRLSDHEIKRKWRKQQIEHQRKFSRSIDTTWRLKQTEAWCGWLLKRSSKLLDKWRCRWFELRPVDATCSSEKFVVLHSCRSFETGTKTFNVTAIQRDPSLDSQAGAVLSLTVLGRRDLVLLAAPTPDIAAELELKISSQLQPATTNPGSASSPSVSSNSIRIRPDTTPSGSGRFGWRLDFLPQADCWRGWLLKRGRGPLASWQRRWFELRRRPPPAAAAAAGSLRSVELHYQPKRGGDCRPRPADEKRLEVAGVRREPGLDGPAGAVLSVDVPGRRGRTLLAAASAAEAEAVVRALGRRLRAADRPTPARPPPPARAFFSR